MAKFANYEEDAQAAVGEYVKAEFLFEHSIIFNLVGAVVRTSRFPDEKTGAAKEEVEFTIQYADDEQADGVATRKFSLSANSARYWFVNHFELGGEELEDMELFKLKATGKGNPPWGFKASNGEAFPAKPTPATSGKNGRK